MIMSEREVLGPEDHDAQLELRAPSGYLLSVLKTASSARVSAIENQRCWSARNWRQFTGSS